MDFTLKTTTSDITNCKNQINAYRIKLDSLITQAGTFVGKLSNYWQGTNASTYLDRFNKTKQDIRDVQDFYQNYVNDLTAAVAKYEGNINTTGGQASNLRTDVITPPSK